MSDGLVKPIGSAHGLVMIAQGLVVILLLLVIVVIPLVRPAPEIPRWEYTVQAIPDDQLPETINALGSQGWEAVSARRASDGAEYKPKFSYEIIFKRPRRDPLPKSP